MSGASTAPGRLLDVAGRAGRLDVAEEALVQLCNPQFAGRGVGTEGNRLARQWIGDRLAAWGYRTDLIPFEAADVEVLRLEASPSLIAVQDGAERAFKHRVDFAEHPASKAAAMPGSGVVRTLLEHLAPGDWLVVRTADELERRAAEVAARGGGGILLAISGRGPFLPKQLRARAPLSVPALIVHEDVIGSIEGRLVRAAVPLSRVPARGASIVGELVGADARLARAPVVLGAHFDGIGDDPGGNRLPAAADNAAGVAVVLQVAQVLADLEVRPRHPLVMAGFDGEEVGALGSRAHATHMVAEGLVGEVINLDGAGRANEAVWVEASENAGRLLAALDRAGRELEIPLVLGPVASDNRRYAEAGFPSVGVALGGRHAHTPADMLDQVEPQAMRTAARLLAATVWLLAYEPEANRG